MVKILVIGGNGFIGSNLVSQIYGRYNLIVLDNNSVKGNNHNKLENVQLITADFADIDRYKSAISEIDGIVILAAVSRVVTAENEVERTWEVNVGNIQRLLSELQFSRITPWIIYGSSREVYGEPSSFPTAENHPLIPKNRYGYTKICAELLLKEYSLNNATSIVILRFSNVYGGPHDHLDRVIPKFIKLAMDDKELQLQGRQNTFDFTHIIDTVDCISLVIKAILSGKVAGFEVFNVCTGVETSLENLALKIIKITNSNSKLKDTDEREYDVGRFVGSFEKAKSLLGYDPKISLQEGIQGYIPIVNYESKRGLK